MNKRNRSRLLALARFFDRLALQLRKYAKSRTPRRTRKEQPA